MVSVVRFLGRFGLLQREAVGDERLVVDGRSAQQRLDRVLRFGVSDVAIAEQGEIVHERADSVEEEIPVGVRAQIAAGGSAIERVADGATRRFDQGVQVLRPQLRGRCAFGKDCAQRVGSDLAVRDEEDLEALVEIAQRAPGVWRERGLQARPDRREGEVHSIRPASVDRRAGRARASCHAAETQLLVARFVQDCESRREDGVVEVAVPWATRLGGAGGGGGHSASLTLSLRDMMKRNDEVLAYPRTRAWWGLALLVAPMLAVASDLTALFFAVPTLTGDLGATATESLWIVHAYGFLIAGFLVTMGRVSDRVGARRLLLWGALAFAALSMVAAFAWSPVSLVLARALLGVAGATLMPSLFSLLREMFPDDDRRRLAIAIMLSAFTVGGAIGPLLGGALLEAFWWGAIFLINVPPMVVLVALGRFALPERRQPQAGRVDVLSVGLSVAGMLAVVSGLQEIVAGTDGRTAPTSSWLPWILVVAGAVTITAFVRRQRRLADPLFDLALLKDRRVTAALLTLLLTGVGVVGLFFLFTQHLQWVGGFTPLIAGVLTLPYIGAQILGSLIAPALVRRFRSSSVLVSGLLVVALGGVLVAGAVAIGTTALLVGAVAVIGLGHGTALALVSDAIISSAPEDRVGSAAAAQEVGGELGTALGIAIGGTVGIVVFRESLDRLAPTGLSEETGAALRSSIHEAFAVARTFTGDAPPLVDLVRNATANGFMVYALISAVLAGVAAAIIAVAFGRR